MAELECLKAISGFSPTREAARRALIHARAAESIHAASCENQIALAVASALIDGTYEEAIQTCQSVLEHPAPPLAAHVWLGELLCSSGRAAQAIEYLQSARQMNPVSLLIGSKLALAFYLNADYEATIQQAWTVLTIEPACAAAQYALALGYQQMRRPEDALTEFANAVECSRGSAAALAGLCHAHNQAGQVIEASHVAARLKRTATSHYVSPCWHALVELAAGRHEAAATSLALAAAAGDHLLHFANQDPRFSSAQVIRMTTAAS